MNEKNKELFTLFNRFHKIKFMDKMVNLSKTEFIVMDKMMHLQKEGEVHGKVTVSDMAGYLCATRPAASKMINQLEDKGYVKRQMNMEDKRITYVELTKEGRGELEKAYKTFHELTDAVFEKMGDEDLNQLIALFKKLFVIIEEESKKRGK